MQKLIGVPNKLGFVLFSDPIIYFGTLVAILDFASGGVFQTVMCCRWQASKPGAAEQSNQAFKGAINVKMNLFLNYRLWLADFASFFNFSFR